MISPKMEQVKMGWAFWMRWQVGLCAAIIAVAVVMSVFVISKAKLGAILPDDMWKTCWRTVHPRWLLAYRGAAFTLLLWSFCELLLMEGTFSFYFYTQWTLMLVIFYFLVATLISAHGCWINSQKHVAEDVDHACALIDESTLSKLKGLLDEKLWYYVMQIAYQTSVGASILTDLVFWCVLVPFMAPEGFTLDLVMGSVHLLNILFLLLDTALNKLSFPSFRMAYFILWSGIYVIFLWILNACGSSWWPYPFLEVDVPWAPICYLSIALVHFPCYAIYVVIARAKISHFPKWFPRAYIESY